MKKADEKRSQILRTALRVVSEMGVVHLTLDNVAAQAGISKGGLLYHFSSKEQLISAMLSFYMDDFNARVDAHIAQDDQPRGRFLRAFVQATLEETPNQFGIISGALSALTYEPALLAQLRAFYEQWKARALADGVGEDVAELVILATDGWWFGRIFGHHTPRNEAALRRWLFTLIDAV